MSAASTAARCSTAASLATALGLALLLEASGLSMSLGAFVAGVLLSDSDFRHELEASIAPFQGLLMGFFFIAVGMGINLGMIVQHPLNVIGFTVGLLAIKGFGLYGLRRLVGGNARFRGCRRWRWRSAANSPSCCSALPARAPSCRPKWSSS